MEKKILCRADGNSITGLGHIYRILAIIAFYKDEYDIIFLTKSNSVVSIIPNEYQVAYIPNELTILEEPNWISNHYSALEYILIADGYQFISSYQKKIKTLGYTLIYIDDLTSEYMYADIVINHSSHCEKSVFKAEKYTQYALGTEYAMLRPVFNEAAKKNREISKIENAFVCFGGTDQYDLSLKAAKALLNNIKISNVHVVLGGAYNHQKIYDLAKLNTELYLYKNLDEYSLYRVMKNCQIAVAPSSTILYELCSVKMPIFSGYYVENQKGINSFLENEGGIFNGGDFSTYSIKDFEQKIELFLKNISINKYLIKQQNLFDGKSKKRFLSLLNQLNISCRKATIEDLMTVYNWSNDTLVRKNSYSSNPILLEDHSDWFLKKIKDTKTLFLIVEINGKPAGIVRYEISALHSVVSIVVSKSYRGQRLASSFLEEGAKVYFKKYDLPILAYIKKENIASIKSFKKAKYIYYKEETIQENSSFVYKLEKNNVIR